ncbi:trichohyalin-like [Teleopsis dalmanni]|uniref:trichohyalin-like n=1 Tax=Teleopsis dalmanni TaxID=139649 RepID=UPI0018CF15E7|nr:trichohyalin-like [Teleopsis dalmanni]
MDLTKELMKNITRFKKKKRKSLLPTMDSISRRNLNRLRNKIKALEVKAERFKEKNRRRIKELARRRQKIKEEKRKRICMEKMKKKRRLIREKELRKLRKLKRMARNRKLAELRRAANIKRKKLEKLRKARAQEIQRRQRMKQRAILNIVRRKRQERIEYMRALRKQEKLRNELMRKEQELKQKQETKRKLTVELRKLQRTSVNKLFSNNQRSHLQRATGGQENIDPQDLADWLLNEEETYKIVASKKKKHIPHVLKSDIIAELKALEKKTKMQPKLKQKRKKKKKKCKVKSVLPPSISSQLEELPTKIIPFQANIKKQPYTFHETKSALMESGFIMDSNKKSKIKSKHPQKEEYEILQISGSKSKLFQDADMTVRRKLGSQKILNDIPANEFLGNLPVPAQKLSGRDKNSHRLSSINVYKVRTDKLNQVERHSLRKSLNLRSGRKDSIKKASNQTLELVPNGEGNYDEVEPYEDPDVYQYYIQHEKKVSKVSFGAQPKLEASRKRKRSSFTSKYSTRSRSRSSSLSMNPKHFERDSRLSGLSLQSTLEMLKYTSSSDKKKIQTLDERIKTFEKRRSHLMKIRQYLDKTLRHKQEPNREDSVTSMYIFELNLESEPEKEKEHTHLYSGEYPEDTEGESEWANDVQEETETSKKIGIKKHATTQLQMEAEADISGYSDDEESEESRNPLRPRKPSQLRYSRRSRAAREHPPKVRALEPESDSHKNKLGKELYEKLKQKGKAEENPFIRRVSKLDEQKLRDYYRKFYKLKQKLENAESDTSFRQFRYAGSIYRKSTEFRPNRPPPVIEVQTTRRGTQQEVKIVRKKISCPADVESEVDEPKICEACGMSNCCGKEVLRCNYKKTYY